MSGVTVVAEHRQGEVRDITYELIRAAAGLKAGGAGPVTVAVIGGDEEVAGAVGGANVDEVVFVDQPSETFEPHLTERALAALIDRDRPAVILCGQTVDGLGFAPALAATQRLSLASNVLSVEYADGSVKAKRGLYGDRVVADLELGGDCAVVMVRPGAYDAAEAGKADPSRVDADLGEAPTKHLGYREPDGDDDAVDITQSEFLLSIGRGIGDEESVERFMTLADKLGATLAASRPLVDSGWLGAGRQVGQSGQTVKPKVYLAMGISGAIQHLAGIRDAEMVIAVNTDPEAPIFEAADYGASLDVHELADVLEARL